MGENNDDATNALIASMLAEDNHYTEYDGYNVGVDSEDDDWGGSKRKLKKGAVVRKSKANKAAPQPAATDTVNADSSAAVVPTDVQNEQQELSATGRRKRKDSGTNRATSRGWSEEEEKLFLEALELHGRDWKAAAAHVGSRDARAFTSHAQKHFIKLAIAGKAVPAKVAESGPGYTLSGKPLDPTSAAAKAYGLKPDVLTRLQAEGSAALPGFQPVSPASDQPEKENCAAQGEGVCNHAAGNDTSTAPVIPNKRQKREPKECKPPKPQPEHPAAQQHAADLGPPPEPTEYVKNRPRRETGRSAMALGHTSESLELVKCHEFVGPPGSGAPLAQPFSVEVDAQVHLTMDFHAHLSSCEIIGLLGGRWDSDRKVISIQQAFPCRRASGSHSGTSVELDPEAEVETRDLMTAQNLTPVGWYHSHPIFAPKPSQKDSENQRNYQALFRCEKTRLEPFIGAIVGPYDLQLPTQASVFAWFLVQTKSGELTPFNIRHTVKAMTEPPGDNIQDQLCQLVESVKEDYGRVNLSAMWRPYCSLLDGQPQGGACSRAEKMAASLRHHMPQTANHAQAVQQFLERLSAKLESCWGVALTAKGGSSSEVVQSESVPSQEREQNVAVEASQKPAVQEQSVEITEQDSLVPDPA